jgi:hypothetical protein
VTEDTYTINYDDGDIEKGVWRRNIRTAKDENALAALAPAGLPSPRVGFSPAVRLRAGVSSSLVDAGSVLSGAKTANRSKGGGGGIRGGALTHRRAASTVAASDTLFPRKGEREGEREGEGEGEGEGGSFFPREGELGGEEDEGAEGVLGEGWMLDASQMAVPLFHLPAANEGAEGSGAAAGEDWGRGEVWGGGGQMGADGAAGVSRPSGLMTVADQDALMGMLGGDAHEYHEAAMLVKRLLKRGKRPRKMVVEHLEEKLLQAPESERSSMLLHSMLVELARAAAAHGDLARLYLGTGERVRKVQQLLQRALTILTSDDEHQHSATAAALIVSYLNHVNCLFQHHHHASPPPAAAAAATAAAGGEGGGAGSGDQGSSAALSATLEASASSCSSLYSGLLASQGQDKAKLRLALEISDQALRALQAAAVGSKEHDAVREALREVIYIYIYI